MSATDGKDARQHVSIVICGHVDSGKSTTTGHLLHKLGKVSEREVEKLKQEAGAQNKPSFFFAYHLDSQKEERQRGVTITCTTKEFSTDNWHYTIIDAPGHRDFIKNMISGAAQADVGLLMIPADGNFTTAIQKGDFKTGDIQGQTRQHARLLNLIGVKQLIVGVNKMDCDMAKYSLERFSEIRDEMASMLVKVGWKKEFVEQSVPIIPISGLRGDNLCSVSENMSWWKGVQCKSASGKVSTIQTIKQALDDYVELPDRKHDAPLRVPISKLYKIKGTGDVVSGRVEQGTLYPSCEVIFVPTHTASNPCTGKVFNIEMHKSSIPFARTGDNVGIQVKGFEKNNLPKSGDVMVLKSDQSLKPAKTFTAQIQALDIPNELKVGYKPTAFVRAARVTCEVIRINWKIGKETGRKKLENPHSIKSNEAAEVVFKPEKPIVVDTFQNCEGFARIAFLEGYNVAMLGKIVAVEH